MCGYVCAVARVACEGGEYKANSAFFATRLGKS